MESVLFMCITMREPQHFSNRGLLRTIPLGFGIFKFAIDISICFKHFGLLIRCIALNYRLVHILFYFLRNLQLVINLLKFRVYYFPRLLCVIAL